MRIELLEYILKIANEGSISKAANKIHIQQTTLSASIKSVEEELKIKIFNRQYSGVTLTAEGEKFVEIATSMINDYYALKSISVSKQKKFTIYVNASLFSLFCNDIYGELCKKNPVLSINVYKIEPTSYIQQMLSKSENSQIAIDYCHNADFELIKDNSEKKGLIIRPLMKTKLTFYVNRSNPLAKRKDITLDMIKDQKLILGNYSSKYLFSKYFDHTFKNYSILEGSDPLQILNLINESNMIAFFADYKTIPLAGLNTYTDIIPIDVQNKYLQDLCFVQFLIYPLKNKFTKEEQLIIENIFEYLSDYNCKNEN